MINIGQHFPFRFNLALHYQNLDDMKMLIFLFFPLFLSAQFGNKIEKPSLWQNKNLKNSLKEMQIYLDSNLLNKAKLEPNFENQSAIALTTNLSFTDFNLSKILPNGDKVYRLLVTSPNALGMAFYFENLKLAPDAKLWMYDVDQKQFIGSYSEENNQADGHFSSSVIEGSSVIIEYLEPKNIATPNFQLTKIYHFYNGLKNQNGQDKSDVCIINASCSEGNKFRNESQATCKILIMGKNSASFCTGTLINNTKNDASPYILTANHCSMNSLDSDYVNWEFHFFYQNTGCSSTIDEESKVIYKGCQSIASSGQDYGIYSSDFLLLKLTQNLNEKYNHTLIGWDISDKMPSSGVCFHHPMGAPMKVSTFNSTPSLGSFSNLGDKTHFMTQWASTANGHSVTQGGSSGSGLLNEKGLLVGTLTGGASSCSRPTKDDFYGRMYMHWDKYNCGKSSANRLKDWLDPIASGVKELSTYKMGTAYASISPIDKTEEWNIRLDNYNLWVEGLEMNHYNVTIYNSVGNKILSQEINANDKIDLNSISSGLYIVEIEYKSKILGVKKFIF